MKTNDSESKPKTGQAAEERRDAELHREHDEEQKLANDALEKANLLPLPEATPTDGPAPAP